MSYLVANPKDRFSHEGAQLLRYCLTRVVHELAHISESGFSPEIIPLQTVFLVGYAGVCWGMLFACYPSF